MFDDSMTLFQYFGFGTMRIKGSQADNNKTVVVSSNGRTWNGKIENEEAVFKMLPGKKEYSVNISGDSVQTVYLGYGETKIVYTKDKDPIEQLSTEMANTKKSVSDGKSKVASAITSKGVSTSADASFATMASNIGSIRKWDKLAGPVSGQRTFNVPTGLNADNFLVVYGGVSMSSYTGSYNGLDSAGSSSSVTVTKTYSNGVLTTNVTGHSQTRGNRSDEKVASDWNGNISYSVYMIV